MIHHSTNEEYKQMLPGVQRKDLVHGRQTHLCEFRLDAGAAIPLHDHPHEQTGVVHQGRIRMTIGDATHDFGPGDAWCIAGNTPHGVEVVAAAVIWEVFAPPREDYLEK